MKRDLFFLFRDLDGIRLMDYLSKIWKIELEILDKFDDFCKKNKLKYSLAYGTLLGAVRHAGFIPWDDDIDVIMPRADYEYLLTNWDIPDYILQNKRTNNDFNQNFTKIRKDHTAFLQDEHEKNVSYHTGIFIDVFPGDRVAPKGKARLQQYFYCALNLLYSREFTSGTKSNFIEKILLGLPRELRLRILDTTDKKIQIWNESDNPFFFPSTLHDIKVFFASDLFDRMTDIVFEGKKYMCMYDYDNYLRNCYGDYKCLPPEEERVLKHHPVFIDTESNYSP
jgi:lipopolysaccharide cholinephosphotransferase